MNVLLLVLAAAAASSVLTLAPAGEPGEPLVLSGIIYAADGETPLPGARLEVHHTDATGHYAPDGGAVPRLKGALVTGGDGRYELRTIRPAPYPGGHIPAHIHARVSGPQGPWHDIHEYWFAGDPLVTAALSAPHADAGRFNPIVSLSRGADGVWRGERDIRIPGRNR